MSKKQLGFEDATITVVGGTGQVTGLFVFGHLLAVCILAPNSAAKYDVDITDAEGFGTVGATDLQPGDNTFQCSVPCLGNHTVSILNATVDGVYRVRLKLG